MVKIENITNHKYLIYSALIGLLIFGIFQLTKGAYYRARHKTLIKNLQTQVSALQSPTDNNDDLTAMVLSAQKILKDLTRSSRRLSADTLTYEKDNILLESLNQYYNYQQEFSGLLAKVFEYNPENDLNSRSISEYKGDFMYRLSLTQYALKQITTKLKKYDDNPELADYTKKITGHFPLIIDLVDQLVEAINKNQIKTSNQLRLQYIKDTQQLQIKLKPIYDQILLELDAIIQKLVSQIK